MKKYIILMIVCCLTSLAMLYGQDTSFVSGYIVLKEKHAIELTGSIGKIGKHSPKFIEIPNQASMGFECNFKWVNAPSHSWKSWYKYPDIGMALGYFHFGNHEVYGSAISLIPNYTRYYGKKKIFFTKIGFGLAYLTKPFHFEDNPKNVVIGSHLNNATVFQLGIHKKLNNTKSMFASVGVFHFSNGSTALPNLGINYLHTQISFQNNFHIKRKDYSNEPKAPQITYKKWQSTARIGLGANARSTPGSPMYPIYVLTVGASKNVSNKNKIYFGADLEYNLGIQDMIEANENFIKSKYWSAMRSAILVGHEFNMGSFGFQTQVGTYIHKGFLKPLPVYFKFGGLQYFNLHLHKKLYAGIFLKTHFGTAEYVEAGIGYVW